MAPAVGLPGYQVQAPPALAGQVTIVHGWNDEVVPVADVVVQVCPCAKGGVAPAGRRAHPAGQPRPACHAFRRICRRLPRPNQTGHPARANWSPPCSVMPAKDRLDKLLVDRGLAGSRGRRRALILAGQVVVGDHAVDKAGTKVDIDAAIRVKGEDIPFVSRGGVKLAHALAMFAVEVTGRAAIDVGASTGGFTDCLLSAGPRRSTPSMSATASSTGSSRRSACGRHGRTNIRRLRPGSSLCVSPDLAVIDVSFISLDKVLPAPGAACPGGRAVALVKPQFEVARERWGRAGSSATGQHAAVVGRSAPPPNSLAAGARRDHMSAARRKGTANSCSTCVRAAPRQSGDYDRRRAMAAHRRRFGADCRAIFCYYSNLLPGGSWPDA